MCYRKWTFVDQRLVKGMALPSRGRWGRAVGLGTCHCTPLCVVSNHVDVSLSIQETKCVFLNLPPSQSGSHQHFSLAFSYTVSLCQFWAKTLCPSLPFIFLSFSLPRKMIFSSLNPVESLNSLSTSLQTILSTLTRSDFESLLWPSQMLTLDITSHCFVVPCAHLTTLTISWASGVRRSPTVPNSVSLSEHSGDVCGKMHPWVFSTIALCALCNLPGFLPHTNFSHRRVWLYISLEIIIEITVFYYDNCFIENLICSRRFPFNLHSSSLHLVLLAVTEEETEALRNNSLIQGHQLGSGRTSIKPDDRIISCQFFQSCSYNKWKHILVKLTKLVHPSTTSF